MQMTILINHYFKQSFTFDFDWIKVDLVFLCEMMNFIIYMFKMVRGKLNKN